MGEYVETSKVHEVKSVSDYFSPVLVLLGKCMTVQKKIRVFLVMLRNFKVIARVALTCWRMSELAAPLIVLSLKKGNYIHTILKSTQSCSVVAF